MYPALFYIAVVIVCLCGCMSAWQQWLGWGWGEAGGWMPLPLRNDIVTPLRLLASNLIMIVFLDELMNRDVSLQQ